MIFGRPAVQANLIREQWSLLASRVIGVGPEALRLNFYCVRIFIVFVESRC